MKNQSMKKSLGLYLHIPFCKSKCRYCAFYSLPQCEDKTIKEYTERLCRHLEEYGACSGSYTVDTLYFGGGTPSLLGGRQLARLIQCAQKNFEFSSRAEITVECNPESVDKRLLGALRRAGVNRLSLGVQSLEDESLKKLGRIHTARQAKDAFDLARKKGFDNISVDLMYALPGQSVTQAQMELRQLLSWQPEHVSLYALTPEENTPLWQERDKLPEEDVQADMYLALCEQMKQAGYEHYEISNFARPGLHSRHNSRYWDLSEYLGLGPAAHSLYGGRRFSFHPDLERYLSGRDVVEEQEDYVTTARHGEYIMLMLRTSRGVDEQEFYRRFHLEFTPYAQKLEPFEKMGLALHQGGAWRLTEQGFLVSNRILSEVLERDALLDDKEKISG